MAVASFVPLAKQVASWDQDYSPSSLPGILPLGAAWGPVQNAGFRGPGTRRLVPVDISLMPPITRDYMLGNGYEGLVRQWDDGLTIAHDRGLITKTAGFFTPQAFTWKFGGGGRTGTPSGWRILPTQLGLAILNLTEGDGKLFNTIVDTAIGVIIGVIANAAGAALLGGTASAGSGAAAGTAGGAEGSQVSAGDTSSTTTLNDDEVTKAIQNSVDSVGSIGNDSLLNASGELGTANSITNSLSNDATKGIGDALSEATSALSSGNGSIFDSISEFIGGARDTLSSIVGPISDTLHQITGLVRQVNDGLIKPITGPITEIITQYKTINAELTRDLHSGVQGLLRIPTDITNALTSVDATMQRSVRALGAANADVVMQTLVPALTAPSGRTLGHVADTWERALAQPGGGFTPPPQVQLGETPGLEAYKEWARQQQEELASASSLPALFFNLLFKVAGIAEGLVAEHEPFTDLWVEEVRRRAPVKKLDIRTTMELHNRGELTRDQVQEELRGQGLSETRVDAIIQANRTLHSTAEAQDLYARGYIDNLTLEAMLRALGWNDEDAQLIENSAHRELDTSTLLELLRRGKVTAGEVQVAMQRTGLREEDAFRLLTTSVRLLGVADMLSALDRAPVAAGGSGYGDIANQPPEAFVALCAKQGIEEADAAVLWSGHYQLLTPSLAVQAWFRGLITRDALRELLLAASLPESVHADYIDLQRPLLTIRQLPAMIKAGVMSQGEAEDYMRLYGYRDEDSLRLIKLALRPSPETTPEHAAELHGLTTSVVVQLYTDGALPRPDADALLLRLGMGTEAAALTLQLIDVKQQASERKAHADIVVADALAGQYDFEGAQRALSALGLTTPEIAKATTTLEAKLSSRSKLPSEAKVLDMMFKGMITREACMQALGLMGYSEAWSSLLIDLRLGGDSGSTTVE